MKLEVAESIKNGNGYVAIVGLGYVGLPMAVAFAEKVKTIGFDNNEEKLALYRNGIDPTNEVGDEKIKTTKLEFSSDPKRLKEAKAIIVAVPTPINGDKTPDLTPVIKASEVIGENLSKGTIVVFESTVYPGVTEDVCRPILEEKSGLKCGADFKVGYSPERINPGDKVNRLQNIVKIVSGIDEETVENLAALYGMIIYPEIYKAKSIKVAEAAKLVENAQRDINIAFMNELSMVFDRMDIKTNDVIEAMNTKWNALGFYPGLVGGHCIGIDPYYFIYKAELLGYHSQIIAAGRKINDQMSEYVAAQIIKKLILADQDIRRANIYVMGLTFKENTPDMRNSKAIDVVKHLAEYGLTLKLVDPVADVHEFQMELNGEYGDKPLSIEDVKDADCMIFLVKHREFAALSTDDMEKMFRESRKGAKKVVIDLKNTFNDKPLKEKGYIYWSL